jgi:hypothetical protein
MLLVSFVVLAVAAAFAYHAALHPMDFRVYHFGARGVFNGTQPVYGLTSGIGWPMHYRYPPLFLLLFTPFALLPLGFSAALWVVLKIAGLIWFARAMFGRLNPHGTQTLTMALMPGILFITPYIVEEFRYGNAQFLVFLLTAAALLAAPERPVMSAASLALAISVKVWPLFFVPYLAARHCWKLSAYTMILVLVLTLLPSVYFGWNGNLHLLGQWFNQEFQTQWGQNEIWFPNQSLRGMLMRYLTVVDYSQVPDRNYPQVNVAALDPSVVRMIWMAIAGAVYAVFLFCSNRRRLNDGLLDHGFGFCLLALLEPFTQKYALAVLLWPALAVSTVAKDSRVRLLIYAAAVLALIQPLAPGADAQRLLQVSGVDFLAATFLTAGMLVGCVTRL